MINIPLTTCCSSLVIACWLNIVSVDRLAGGWNTCADMNVKSHSMLNTLFERMRMFAGNLTGGIDASERERLDLVLRGTNDGIWDWNLESGYVFFSPRWKSMLGYDEADILPRLDSWLELIHPDDLPETRRILEAHLNGGGEPYEIEHRLRHKDGSFRWILTRGAAERDEQGRAIRMLGSHTDITARRRAEGIQAGQHQVLELLAAGGSLSQTLQRLLEVIEEQSPGMLGLVLLLDEDGQRLHIGAGPSLPQDYLESIEGLEIGPQVGSCGTASFTGTRVIVTDIARDPRWDNLRDLALQYNLRACWSEPVFSPSGRVIGTFAMYYKEPRSPTEAELRDIATGAHLAGVAIQRSRADAALLESERRLSTLMSNLPGMAYRCANDPSWPMSFVSRGSTVLTGYAPEELADGGKVAYGDLVHPDDRETTWDAVQTALASNDAYQITYRITTASGEEKWVWEQGSGVYDEDGALLALEGFVTDATERVLARQMLEQRVEERTHELSTLLKVSQDVASTLEPEALQGQVLDQLKAVVDYDGASVLVLQDQTLCVRAYRGPIPIEEALRLTFPLSEAGVNRAVIERREPIWIPDVRGDTPQARAFRQMAGDALTSTYNYVRSWLGVPLIARGQILGMLSLDHDQADYYTAQHSRLALAFANQVAVTIDNARLYRAAERRADEAQTLVTVQQAITGKHDQTSILQLIADEACRLTEAQRAMVFMLGNGALEMSVLSGYEDSSLLGYRMSLENSLTGRALRERRARRSADARNDPHAD